MAERSSIEWCDATFNPWIGCTKVSPACDHCYAERNFDLRRHVVQWGAGQARKRTAPANWKNPERWNKQAFCECPACGWRGEAREAMRGCDCPSCMQPGVLVSARRRVFCASLADWLDNEVPVEWLVDLLDLIRSTPNLDWLLLSKRIGNWRKRIEAVIREIDGDDPCELKSWLLAWIDDSTPRNVWLGATICNQAEADRDIPKLLSTPAAVRFLSIEPMLGPVDLTDVVVRHGGGTEDHFSALYDADDDEADTASYIDWVICGGESGPHARPMHPHWARDLRDQCAAAGVPFLFKQWGEWLPISEQTDEFNQSLYRSNRIAQPGEGQRNLDDLFGRTCKVEQSVIQADGTVLAPLSPMAFQQGKESMLTFRIGKKAAGRLLDGRTHDAFPKGGA